MEDELIAVEEEALGAFYQKRLANTCNGSAGLALFLTTSNHDEDRLAAYNNQVAGYLLKSGQFYGYSPITLLGLPSCSIATTYVA